MNGIYTNPKTSPPGSTICDGLRSLAQVYPSPNKKPIIILSPTKKPTGPKLSCSSSSLLPQKK